MDREKLRVFILENGFPPCGASCLRDDGYWIQAVKAACETRRVTPRLVKAVSSHWYGDLNRLKSDVLHEIKVLVSNS